MVTDATGGPSNRLRVMTWNIHGAARPNRSMLARAIHAQAADLVMLQEIRIGQAHRLANRLGYHVIWARKHFPLGPAVWWRAEGLAVLSPHRITQAATWLLSPKEGRSTYRRRIALRADLAVKGRTIAVVNTHLASHDVADPAQPDGRRVRAEQAKRLVSLFTEHGPEHAEASAIVAGDLNTDHEPEVLAPFVSMALKDCWGSAIEQSGGPCTSPAADPVQRIDYVLVGQEWTVAHAMVPAAHGDGEHPWQSLSDHLPLIVDLTTE